MCERRTLSRHSSNGPLQGLQEVALCVRQQQGCTRPNKVLLKRKGRAAFWFAGSQWFRCVCDRVGLIGCSGLSVCLFVCCVLPGTLAQVLRVFAGKSTLINCLTGLFSPSEGTASIYGNSILTDIDAVREVMGLCPQVQIAALVSVV